MTFREQLSKVSELGISICDLEVANECDGVFDFEYTEQEFEWLCDFAQQCYLKDQSGNITPNHIAKAINELITEDGKTIQEVLDINRWDMLDKASYYC